MQKACVLLVLITQVSLCTNVKGEGLLFCHCMLVINYEQDQKMAPHSYSVAV